MRLPYVPNPPTPSTPEESSIISAIQARRHPRPLQPLDLALLHSPLVASGWNSFLGAVRTQSTLPADLRELAISRVAVCNRAWYEWAHHAPLAVQAGVDEDIMKAVVRREGPFGAEEACPEGLNGRQWAVLRYTDEMTREVQVRDGTFEALKGLFSEREIVEITATVSPCVVVDWHEPGREADVLIWCRRRLLATIV
jgi:alkylhydroperoxidase family enzyme